MSFNDREFLDRVKDFFEPYELVQYLGLTIEDIVEVYDEEVLEKERELNAIMGYEDELPDGE